MQRWTGRPPNVAHIRVFGCRCFVHLEDNERPIGDKTAAKSTPATFLGYQTASKGYLVMLPNHRVLTRRNVIFNESFAISVAHRRVRNVPQPISTLGQAPMATAVEEAVDADTTTSLLSLAAQEYALTVQQAQQALQIPVPASYTEAVHSPQHDHWKAAIADELKSMHNKGVWKVVPRNSVPEDKKILTTTWNFKVKQNPNGTVSRYKARLCARGFLQIPGQDFHDTFAAVAKLPTLRALLSVAAARDLELLHLDIKTAFLHADVEEEIYVHPPQGLDVEKDHVLRLLKALYGLRQASRRWNKTIHRILLKLGFVQSEADPCLYVYSDGDVFMIIYVDDILIAHVKEFNIDPLITKLGEHFDIGSKEELKYFIGIQIVRDRANRKIHCLQSRYIQDVIYRFHMQDCNPAPTPAVPSSQPLSEGSPLNKADHGTYRSLVGAVLWVAVATRVDIQMAVSLLTQHVHQPTSRALTAAKRVLRFLKATQNECLTFQGAKLQLVGQCDASWGNDRPSRRSYHGFVFSLNGGAISWSAKLQPIVALSTVEAEYIALCAAAQEAIWLRKLCNFLRVPVDSATPTVISQDNEGARQLTENPVHHRRTKHIDIKYHFTRECVERNEIQLQHVPSSDLAADLLTKILSRATFLRHAATLLHGSQLDS